MAYNESTPFSDGASIRPAGRTVACDPTDASAFVTGSRFTVTNTNVTPVLATIGGRSAWKFTNSGTLATDGSNMCVPAACIAPQAGKKIVLRSSVRFDTVATGEFAFGLGVVGTGMIATDPTDHIMIRKLTGATNFSLRARNNSGTAETWTLDGTLAADKWYDLVLEIEDVGSGKGYAKVFMGTDLAGGGQMSIVAAVTIATQFPDRAAAPLAPFHSVRAGTAANVTIYTGGLSWVIQD